jgi:hypothetical protein
MQCVQFSVYQTEYWHGTPHVSDFDTRLTSLTNFLTVTDANIKSNFFADLKERLKYICFFMSCMSTSGGIQVTFHTILTSFWCHFRLT